MWRNFGWTAILAIWTIFLILNSGLAGERISNNPRINSARTSREARRGATVPGFDKQFVDDSRLRHVRETFEVNDRSSTRTGAVSPGLKNTGTRDFNGPEERITMSNAIATSPECSGRSGYDDGGNARRLAGAAERVATGNMWLSKIVIPEKPGNTRYRGEYPLNSRVSSPTTLRQLKGGLSKRRKHKEGVTCVFANGRRKEATLIRRDARRASGETDGRKGRISSGANKASGAFFHGKFSKRRKQDASRRKTTTENSAVPKFETPAEPEELRERNEKNRSDSRGGRGRELTRNSASETIRVEANGDSATSRGGTFPSSRENRSRKKRARTAMDVITGDAIARSPSAHRSRRSLVPTAINGGALISGVSGARGKVREIPFSRRYHSPKGEYSKSDKAVAESRSAIRTHTNGRSKVGFQVNRGAREDRKWNENIGESFTFRAPNLPDGPYLGGNRIGFVERPSPPAARKKEGSALSAARDTAASPRREHHSSVHNVVGAVTDGGPRIRRKTRLDKGISGDANCTTHNDPLSPNSPGGRRIDGLKATTTTSPRISVTQRWNPMHVRDVKSAGTACERRRTTGVRARIGFWNGGPPAKFGGLPVRRARSRPRHSLSEDVERPPSSRVLVRATPPGSISLDVVIIADNSIEPWKINGRALSPSSSGESTDDGRKNAKVLMKNPDENEDDARKESGCDSTYRRYKRQEVGPSTRESSTTLTEPETRRRALDAITTVTTVRRTTRPSAEFTASPSISTPQMSDRDRVSVAAEGSITTGAASSTPPKYRRGFQPERRSITPTGTPAKMGSDSLEIPFIAAPKTSNVSEPETLLIKTPDRSAAVTKADNFFIRKEEADASAAEVTGARASTVSPSIEPISPAEGRAANGPAVPIIDPLPQRSSDPTRDVLSNVTTENVDDPSAGTALLDQWPVKHSAVVEGDLVLGGLMMVHEREDTITCGPVMPQGGVQALEAMLYTLDTLNDKEIVPGVKIGAHILDDCDKDTYGLEMAVDFIKGSISNIDGAEYHCNKTAVRKIISGVVGAASSVTSIQVANLLRLFRIPQVSFFSTSPELSNKQRFEYFTRTIPSDHYQVKAMVDIVLKMGWSYVSIIYEESNYGIKAFEELEELLGKHNICIAIKEKLVKDSGVAEEIAYDNIVSKLLTKPRARGCIIFGSDQEVAGVMRAVRRCNATGAFSWIGSDGWSARGLVSNGNEPEVEGTLSVQPQANPVKGFEEYFLNLTVENNRRNPWFVEFWEDHFKCRYPNASRTPYNKKYSKTCTTKERLTKQNTAFEDQLQFVSDAVMAFAYAFRDMHRDLCHERRGLCDAMKPTNGTKLLQYLRKVDFEGLSGDEFRFDKNGDGPARYNIIHFKQTEPGKYKWVRVGKYLEGELRLNMSEIQFKLGHPQPPESVCSLPCEVGQAKKYVEGERCCWHCFNCTQYQIRHPKDETQCSQCRRGTVPDETHSTCRDIPEEFLRPESGWAIGAMFFSAAGIFVTLFVCGVFLRHNDTPVVRASGRELSYVLLVGILLCYLVTFTLVLRPTDAVCSIQRVAAGLCFTVVYAALLTKTNRIARIFNDGRQSAKRPSFISPRSQLIICFGLVSVQILINVVWILIDPARAMHHYPTMEDNLLVCNSYIDASYMIAFAYPIILIAVCTVYAVLTRKIPEAFNESKHIGFAMYTTCVIWLAFVPLYFGTGTNVALRITSMSVTISLSASVMVVCLFSPKLYIILIRPERNVRPNIKAGRPNLTKSSAITATNPSSMMGPVAATTVLTAATCDQNKAIKRHIASTIDCSTQSEYYEMEVKEQKNGKPLATCASRSTQTTNIEKESTTTTTTAAASTTTTTTTTSLTTTTVAASNKESSDIVASACNKESKNSAATAKRLNSNARIGNGPLSQSDVSL